MAGEISRGRFIRLGATMGAVSYLAACGGSEETPPEEEADQPETEQPSGNGEAAIAAEDEVAPGEALDFEDGGEPAVLVHLDGGDFVAYSAVCTHQGCEVAYRNGELACPCHGSVFDPANGAEVLNGPASSPLPEIPVEVRDGEVFRA